MVNKLLQDTFNANAPAIQAMWQEALLHYDGFNDIAKQQFMQIFEKYGLTLPVHVQDVPKDQYIMAAAQAALVLVYGVAIMTAIKISDKFYISPAEFTYDSLLNERLKRGGNANDCLQYEELRTNFADTSAGIRHICTFSAAIMLRFINLQS